MSLKTSKKTNNLSNKVSKIFIYKKKHQKVLSNLLILVRPDKSKDQMLLFASKKLYDPIINNPSKITGWDEKDASRKSGKLNNAYDG